MANRVFASLVLATIAAKSQDSRCLSDTNVFEQDPAGYPCECYAEVADPGNQCGGASFFQHCDADTDKNTGNTASEMCEECQQCTYPCQLGPFGKSDDKDECHKYGEGGDPGRDCDKDVDPDTNVLAKHACEECGVCTAPTPMPTEAPECQGNPYTWVGMDYCPSYSENHLNNHYCDEEYPMGPTESIKPKDVCPQCGWCKEVVPGALDPLSVEYQLELTTIVAGLGSEGIESGWIYDSVAEYGEQIPVNGADIEVKSINADTTLPPTPAPVEKIPTATPTLETDVASTEIHVTDSFIYAIAENKACGITRGHIVAEDAVNADEAQASGGAGSGEDKDLGISSYGPRYLSLEAVSAACDEDENCAGFWNTGYNESFFDLEKKASTDVVYFKCERANFGSFKFIEPEQAQSGGRLMHYDNTPRVYYKTFFDCADARLATFEKSADKSFELKKMKNNPMYWMLMIDPSTGNYWTEEVYCKVDVNKNYVWTLIESFSKADNDQVAESPFSEDKELGAMNSDFKFDDAYRMSKRSMEALAAMSDHVNVECSWPDQPVSYGRADPPNRDDLTELWLDDQDSARRQRRTTRDSAWWQIAKWNPLEHTTGQECVEVDYVDIRGNYCEGTSPCKVKFQCEADQHCHVRATETVQECVAAGVFKESGLDVPLGGYETGKGAKVCHNIKKEQHGRETKVVDALAKCVFNENCVPILDDTGRLAQCNALEDYTELEAEKYQKICHDIKIEFDEAEADAAANAAEVVARCNSINGCVAEVDEDGGLKQCNGEPIVNEDAFGYYANGLDEFQCWSKESSTTQWYFGRKLVEPTPQPTMTPTTETTFEGCYNENVDDRALDVFVGAVTYNSHGSDENEAESAIRECALKCAGYDFFGIQQLWQCYCGNSDTYDKYGLTDKPCSCNSWYVGWTDTICVHRLRTDERCLPADGIENCCTVENPCTHGGGDCNHDSQCVSPAVCVEDAAHKFGGTSTTMDICMILPDGETQAAKPLPAEIPNAWAVVYTANFPNMDSCEYKKTWIQENALAWDRDTSAAFSAAVGADASLHIINAKCNDLYVGEPETRPPTASEVSPTSPPTTPEVDTTCSYYDDIIIDPITAYAQVANGVRDCRTGPDSFIPAEYTTYRGERRTDGQICSEDRDDRGYKITNPFIKCLANVVDRSECERFCSRSAHCVGYEWNQNARKYTCILMKTMPPLGNGVGWAECWAKNYSPQAVGINESSIKPVCINKFTHENLSEEMVQCAGCNMKKNNMRDPQYAAVCPTKAKVKENSYQRKERKENDANETLKIKAAQANKMWKSCGSWCLFDAERPAEISWIWKKNKKCWQRQGGAGNCMKASNGERQYAIKRSTKFCGVTVHPTISPTFRYDTLTWVTTRQGFTSCTAACARVGKTCQEGEFGPLMNNQLGLADNTIREIFLEAGINCKQIYENGSDDSNGPMYRVDNKGAALCTLRHPNDVGSECDGQRFRSFNRLCPCI